MRGGAKSARGVRDSGGEAGGRPGVSGMPPALALPLHDSLMGESSAGAKPPPSGGRSCADASRRRRRTHPPRPPQARRPKVVQTLNYHLQRISRLMK